MGMTIEEALNLLNNSRPNSNNAFSIQMNEAINVISETMRNYQKIEEIINKWYEDKTWEFDTSYLYEIGEIIKDGNEN